MADVRGGPYGRVPSKTPFAKVPIQVDWHNYLALKWASGVPFNLGQKVRLDRLRSRGLQYRATTSGVAANREPVWPTAEGRTIVDGSVVWIAEAIDASSLRSAISSDVWIGPTGIVLSGAQSGGLIYQIFADGGVSGDEYEIKHQVVLANGEEQEAIVVLPVVD